MHQCRIHILNLILVFLLLNTTSCGNNNTYDFIAGDDYKVWDLQRIDSDGDLHVVGCYYFDRKGYSNYFRYAYDENGEIIRVNAYKEGNYPYPRKWKIIDKKTIEFMGAPCKIIKLDKDTFHLYCEKFYRNPDFLMVKSKDQTRPE